MEFQMFFTEVYPILRQQKETASLDLDINSDKEKFWTHMNNNKSYYCSKNSQCSNQNDLKCKKENENYYFLEEARIYYGLEKQIYCGVKA